MESNTIDIAVAIIFFNRPDSLKKVFEAIRASRPSTLFLIQDGARNDKPSDAAKVEECRKVVSNIDWPCNVTRLYRKENRGVAYNIYSGITEAFEIVDKLVIIEDDIIIDPSFLPFCKTMLEKYADDERVFAITGMNHIGEYKKCPYSYFFSDIGSCWGWATWKQSWMKMEFDSSFLEDHYAVNCFLNSKIRTKMQRKAIIRDSEKRRKALAEGRRITGWAHQFMTSQYMNNGLWIVPQTNLISNIGLSEESVHAANNIKFIPSGLKTVFFGKRTPMTFPLSHPKYMICDYEYSSMVLRVLGEGFVNKVVRKLETYFRFIVFSNLEQKKDKLLKLFKK